MLVTLAGMCIEVIAAAFLNASSLMLVTPSGIATAPAQPVPLKATTDPPVIVYQGAAPSFTPVEQL
jgi:hypothetical protein